MDAHIYAYEWLESHLEDKLFQFTVDEIRAMEEAVLCQRGIQ